ncbi:hypothetical protein E3O42_13355 [Cryobacterium adonitolivorans]|uniref:Uncharacterized protein n=1 Tax=Cryobacterium adonitolivorans TaxID=1259189 RepID=A0A4R8W4K2_9MICO|nr:hypothetical protein [Cryobacterium adonitolivorans]TFB99537.1 hypothetical protein E3O42_13355 [Cryobacterium adonitolivorans]
MTDTSLIGRVSAPDLHVMTYNIRRRVPTLRRGSADRWDTRKLLLQRLLAAPDLLQQPAPEDHRCAARPGR